LSRPSVDPARSRARRPVRLLIIAFLASWLTTGLARAASVVDVQPPATPGQDAPDAVAIAITLDPTNHAEAIGGAGRSIPGSPSRGGDATAVAETATPGSAQATAVARGGSASGAASGGDAAATATASNSTAAPVRVSVIAAGGEANPSFTEPIAGHGGDATVDARAESTADGATLEIGVLTIQGSHAGAFGGAGARFASSSDPPGTGGDASSRSVAVALGNSRVRVVDRAQGGSAETGQAGSATSYAEGSNGGSESVTVESYATTGMGRIPGQASARARGTSSGGGNVSARAEQIAGYQTSTSTGGVSVQRDAVSGGTSGRLTLEQRVTGTSSRQVAGDALAALSASNELGGDLVATVRATGGNLLDAASGGGGAATIERFDFVGSEGREVALMGEATGGSAGGHDTSRGGDASIASHIAGSRAAAFSLSLRATGGAGDPTGSSASPYSNGGHAAIDSSVETGSDTLVLDLAAAGGNGGGSGQRAGDGGDAAVHASASNSGGAASLVAHARAANAGGANGSATPSGARAGRGGDATIDVDVSTAGDGNAITVGLASSFPAPASGAWGGQGSVMAVTVPTAAEARGGDASSSSIARAAGRSDVTVYDLARGGDAGGSARGGNASSRAIGESEGGNVVVEAEASAGRGYRTQEGATAVLDDVYGRSTTGDVRVFGEAVGGEGGNGADVLLLDAVGGETAGHLSLEQNAIGGGAHFQSTLAGRGGSARSALHHVGASSAMSLDVYAAGGYGFSGGTGEASIDVQNRAGSVDARARGFGADSRRERGADATTRIDVVALTDVEIGEEDYGDDPYDGRFGANGGEGGYLAGTSGLDGGDAESRSTGRSETGAVRVFDAARGGSALTGFFSTLPDGSRPDDGGAARSFAWAESQGSGTPVLARSVAAGGTGGEFYDDRANESHFGQGGEATAESHAIGLGVARAEALASAGYFGASQAIATASARGARSEVDATAASQNHFLLRDASVSIGAAIDGGSALARSAALDVSDADSPWPALDPTAANASARLVLGSVDAVTAPGLPGEHESARTIASFEFAAGGAAGTFQSSAALQLTSSAVHEFRNLQITLTDGTGLGELEGLRIRVHQGSTTFLDQSYDELASVLTAFDGDAIPLDGFVQVPDFAWYRTNHPISIALDWATQDPAFVFSGRALLTTVVPEPGTALLVGWGLGLLAWRRGRR